MTLAGTNTYVVGRDPAYVIDPGPADPGHLAEIREAAAARGGIGGILLTHSHRDHTEGAPMLDSPVLLGEVGTGDEFEPQGTRNKEQVLPDRVGPFSVLFTPGHATDHVCLVLDRTCFCGDLILGEGSSIVPPVALGGSLTDYMESLRRLAGLDLDLLCPGHGPWITDPTAKVAEYTAHRLDRERRLLAALEGGERSRRRLQAAAWGDVPEVLRPAAAFAMQAHLEKLEAEGRLPEGLTD